MSLSDKQKQEIWDIIDMYSKIRLSFLALDYSDKQGIDPDEVMFPGFDLNEEPDQFDYAKKLMYNDKDRLQDKYEEFHNLTKTGINSHRPMINIYRKQLAAWNAMSNKNRLSKEQILQLLAIL